MKEAKDFVISKKGREILSIPIGIIIYREPSDALDILKELIDNYSPPLIITVGDVVTKNFLKKGFKVNIAVLDGKTLRRKVIEYNYITNIFNVKITCNNPPGFLKNEALTSVREAVKKAKEGLSVVIVVKGEEDLLGIPALLYSPEKTIIVYGYWKGGIGIMFSCKYFKKSFNKLIKEYFTTAEF